MSFLKKLFGGSPSDTALEQAAQEGDRDRVQQLLTTCSDQSTIQRAIKLANEGKWHAVARDLQEALDKYSNSKCPECGGDEMTSEVASERGYEVTFIGVFVTFRCHKCAAWQRVNVKQIDLDKGVSVLCSCRAISFIPPSVWCKTCRNVLVRGWQSKIENGRR